MRLLELLSALSSDEVDRLAHEHGVADSEASRPQMLLAVESVLRSHRFIQDFLVNRRPPAFAAMLVLLDAPDYALPTGGFREAVLAEVARLCESIESGGVLRRDDQLGLYRRVLYQARSNDMHIDGSEAAILGVLRHELGIEPAEHFLIEHHPDFREFWQQDGSFARELHALRSAGLVFAHDGNTMLAEDLVPVVRQVLGLDMSRVAAWRLYEHLSVSSLHEALSAVGAATSGSKDEKLQRLRAHLARPRMVLRRLSLESLKDVCRDVGVPTSGVKEELVERIVVRVAAGRDLIQTPEPPPLLVIDEPRSLDRARFVALFSKLRGHELAEILAELDLKRWGGKEAQVRTAWESKRSETTLLSALSNGEVENLLRRLDLKVSGTKSERVQRVIEHFGSLEQTAFDTALVSTEDRPGPAEAEHREP
jgi:hypothetical protein